MHRAANIFFFLAGNVKETNYRLMYKKLNFFIEDE